MKITCLLVLTILCGCSTAGSRLITVQDEEGRPIAGTLTYPQPVNAGRTESDTRGLLRVYPGGPKAQFVLIRKGYADAAFAVRRTLELTQK